MNTVFPFAIYFLLYSRLHILLVTADKSLFQAQQVTLYNFANLIRGTQSISFKETPLDLNKRPKDVASCIINQM